MFQFQYNTILISDVFYLRKIFKSVSIFLERDDLSRNWLVRRGNNFDYNQEIRHLYYHIL